MSTQIRQFPAGGKPEPDSAETVCWVVTDGKVGMETQCVGLAEALGFVPVVKRIRLRQPWRALNPWLPIPGRRVFAPGSDALVPPWPDVIIATGRQSSGPALYAKKRTEGRVFCVQIQDAGVAPDRFDLVVVPEHDKVRGANVVTTLGALNRVTPERLAAEGARWAQRLAHLPAPRLAVLIGGDNGAYRLTPGRMRALADRLAALARDGWGLMVTPSRRTGAANEAVLRDALAGVDGFVWDGTGDNPYVGFLGLADAIVVTADSVNMVTEAAGTGRPVHVVDLDGGSPKFAAFHASMRGAGIARPFEGGIGRWDYPPLLETARVAGIVRERLRSRA